MSEFIVIDHVPTLSPVNSPIFIWEVGGNSFGELKITVSVSPLVADNEYSPPISSQTKLPN